MSQHLKRCLQCWKSWQEQRFSHPTVCSVPGPVCCGEPAASSRDWPSPSAPAAGLAWGNTISLALAYAANAVSLTSS